MERPESAEAAERCASPSTQVAKRRTDQAPEQPRASAAESSAGAPKQSISELIECRARRNINERQSSQRWGDCNQSD